MAFRNYLILFVGGFLASCAQLGTLTGGEEDSFAPIPVEGKTVPPNESIQFQGNSISIEFDEYIELNNAAQNITLVPAHAKLKASIHKKTLKLEWEETLQENTTYVVYLNGAVKDISEGNKSYLSYVFSTGNSIDSLKYHVRVEDAWTSQPASQVTVGLFIDKDSVKPYYFAKCDNNGEAEFSFLHAGSYYLRAFNDENQDLKIQVHEPIAFRENQIEIDSMHFDSIPLRMYKPRPKNKITTFRAVPPGCFIVGANFNLEKSKITLNNAVISSSEIVFLTEDSLLFYTDFQGRNEAEIIIQQGDFIDTLTTRIIPKEKPTLLTITSKLNTVSPLENLSFSLNDKILSVDTSLIRITNSSDSSVVNITGFSFINNTLQLVPENRSAKQLEIVFLPGALKTAHGNSEPGTFTCKLNTEKDYGIINLDMSSFDGPVIVELISSNKVIRRLNLTEKKTARLEFLDPAEYSFRVIADENGNGKWDEGDLKAEIQPEKVYHFSKSSKIRANWEVEVKLDPND